MNLWRSRTIVAVLSIAALAAGYFGGRPLLEKVQFARAAEDVEATRQQLATVEDLSTVFRHVGNVVGPSVVQIRVHKTIKEQGGPDLPDEDMRRFFREHGFPDFSFPPQQFEEIGTGSGVIMEVSEGYGYVLTNNHVAGDAGTIDIQLADGRKIANRDISLVGADPKSDLAVLRIKADRLIAAKWGNSDELQRGDWVMAFGSPFGYIGSMTHGIVSAMNRDHVGIIGSEGYENFIQVDAPINPGNSGGPLVNIHGEVIGINTAIASRTGGFQGIGFAIPSNQAKGVFAALREHHVVVRGWLGISLQDVDYNPDLAKSFGYQGEHGVIVSGVAPNGPSENKLLPQDIITALNGQPVADGQQLRNLVAGIAPGTAANVTVFRDGKEQQVQVVVGTQPRNLAAAMEGSSGGGEAEITGENQTLQALGMSLATLDKQTAQKIGIDSGAVITEVKRDGLAFNAGLSPGDVITMVFKTPVHSAAEAAEALNAADLKKGVRLYVFTRDQEGHHMYRFVFIKSSDTSPQ